LPQRNAKSENVMNLKQKFVVTINRELGSGGRTVGRKLSERLGVPFYDKALIKSLQEMYHLNTEQIEKLKGRSHSWWAEFKRTLTAGYQNDTYYQTRMGEEPDVLTTDEIFKNEQEILKAIAKDESCVVAGRSGFFVFRDHPNHMSILIQASMDFRIDRVARKQHKSPEEARKIIDKVDKMRENYVNKYTKTSRYDTRNYDLVITADGKTEDEIVNIILMYIGQYKTDSFSYL